MQLEDYFDFFENPYAIRLKGHRIGLEHIVGRYRKGCTPEQIVQDFPEVPLEQIYAAIAYYLHNKAQVDEYMAEIDRFVEEQVRQQAATPDPLRDRMRTVQEQWRREGRIHCRHASCSMRISRRSSSPQLSVSTRRSTSFAWEARARHRSVRLTLLFSSTVRPSAACW